MDVMRSKRGWEIIMPFAENQSLKAACRKIIQKPCIFHDKDEEVEINRDKLTHVETQKKCAVSDYLEKKEMTGKILPR
jgi:hypothetical protein